MVSKSKYIGLIPFFSRENELIASKQLQYTIDAFRDFTDLVYVVNDGSGTVKSRDAIVINHDNNRGKADAIRTGLVEILNRNPDCFIIESDSDHDQEPKDGVRFLDYFKKNNVFSTDSVLLIGDRYTPRGFENLHSHRNAMNELQLMFFSLFGIPVRDSVSGIRAYSCEFARSFVRRSISYNFGIGVEQVVSALLDSSLVDNIDLSYARQRDPFTSAEKLIQCVDAILLHKENLKQRNPESIDALGAFEEIECGLNFRKSYFSINLDAFNRVGMINFTLEGSNYSANMD